MKQSVADVENPLKFDFNQRFYSYIAVQFRIVYNIKV